VRIAVAHHHLSIEPAGEWVADEMPEETLAAHGLYLRSIDHGVYLNVRAQDGADHPLTPEGLLALLREQAWASAPFDEWTTSSGPVDIVAGTFETVGMGGEVVLETFLTDGRRLANIAGVGERAAIRAVTPAARRLARTLRFE
jgi:hypothetical protein